MGKGGKLALGTVKSQSSRSGPQAGGELALIAAIRARRQPANAALRLGIGDDGAIIRPKPGEEIVVTAGVQTLHPGQKVSLLGGAL